VYPVCESIALGQLALSKNKLLKQNHLSPRTTTYSKVAILYEYSAGAYRLTHKDHTVASSSLQSA